MGEFVEREWLDWIERHYGVRLGPGQLYEQHGRLYAGSEYVCSHPGDGPENAVQWADQISHFPRGTGRLITSTRREVN